MNSSKSSLQPNPLSQKNSRILLTTLILFTVVLAYFAAMGIKAAGENEEFQKAMEEMQQNSYPVISDSLNTSNLDRDSLNRP